MAGTSTMISRSAGVQTLLQPRRCMSRDCHYRQQLSQRAVGLAMTTNNAGINISSAWDIQAFCRGLDFWRLQLQTKIAAPLGTDPCLRTANNQQKHHPAGVVAGHCRFHSCLRCCRHNPHGLLHTSSKLGMLAVAQEQDLWTCNGAMLPMPPCILMVPFKGSGLQDMTVLGRVLQLVGSQTKVVVMACQPSNQDCCRGLQI